MNQQRLKQLNQHHEGYHLTEEQIVSEYNQQYRPEATPWTNPELFDPLHPPAGWEYDAWHAVWYKLPTDQQIKIQMTVVRVSFWITTVLLLCVAVKMIIL